jgi:hypothetical protein
MHIFWGGKTLGYHVSQYALFLSVLHEGKINFLVCLSSHLMNKKIHICFLQFHYRTLC